MRIAVMAKNKIQFQSGYSLFQLYQDYGTEEQCHKALYKWRWPSGFYCPECGCQQYCLIKTRRLYQCNRCHHQTSVISGTIFFAYQVTVEEMVFGDTFDHTI